MNSPFSNTHKTLLLNYIACHRKYFVHRSVVCLIIRCSMDTWFPNLSLRLWLKLIVLIKLIGLDCNLHRSVAYTSAFKNVWLSFARWKLFLKAIGTSSVFIPYPNKSTKIFLSSSACPTLDKQPSIIRTHMKMKLTLVFLFKLFKQIGMVSI